jgi:hypothetical protein
MEARTGTAELRVPVLIDIQANDRPFRQHVSLDIRRTVCLPGWQRKRRIDDL